MQGSKPSIQNYELIQRCHLKWRDAYACVQVCTRTFKNGGSSYQYARARLQSVAVCSGRGSDCRMDALPAALVCVEVDITGTPRVQRWRRGCGGCHDRDGCLDVR